MRTVAFVLIVFLFTAAFPADTLPLRGTNTVPIQKNFPPDGRALLMGISKAPPELPTNFVVRAHLKMVTPDFYELVCDPGDIIHSQNEPKIRRGKVGWIIYFPQ